MTRLPWDRERAADDEHVELGVDLDDLKVLDGDSLHTVLARADLALEDTAGVGGGAHGTGVTVDRAAAVGHTTAAGVPALDNARCSRDPCSYR